MTVTSTSIRRTGMAWTFLAAIVILLLTLDTTSALASGTDETEGPVWSADMLVVEYTEVSTGAATADLFSNVGGTGLRDPGG